MSEIVIVGIGQTPVGEHWDTSLRDLALQAVQAALRRARQQVRALVAVHNQPNLGGKGVPALRAGQRGGLGKGMCHICPQPIFLSL